MIDLFSAWFLGNASLNIQADSRLSAMTSLDIDLEVSGDEPSDAILCQIGDLDLLLEIDAATSREVPRALASEALLDEPLWAVWWVLDAEQRIQEVTEIRISAWADAENSLRVNCDDCAGDWCSQTWHRSVHDYSTVYSAVHCSDQLGRHSEVVKAWVIDWLYIRAFYIRINLFFINKLYLFILQHRPISRWFSR